MIVFVLVSCFGCCLSSPVQAFCMALGVPCSQHLGPGPDQNQGDEDEPSNQSDGAATNHMPRPPFHQPGRQQWQPSWPPSGLPRPFNPIPHQRPNVDPGQGEPSNQPEEAEPEEAPRHVPRPPFRQPGQQWQPSWPPRPNGLPRPFNQGLFLGPFWCFFGNFSTPQQCHRRSQIFAAPRRFSECRRWYHFNGLFSRKKGNL